MDSGSEKLSSVEKLKKRRDSLNARIQKMEATEKARERKRNTRRKILVGSYYLEQDKKNGSMSEINTIMDKFLVRDSDRVLFGLEKK